MKNGGKNKSVAFTILLSVYIYMYIYIYIYIHSAVKRFLPLPVSFFVHICHSYKIQIIKQM